MGVSGEGVAGLEEGEVVLSTGTIVEEVSGEGGVLGSGVTGAGGTTTGSTIQL